MACRHQLTAFLTGSFLIRSVPRIILIAKAETIPRMPPNQNGASELTLSHKKPAMMDEKRSPTPCSIPYIPRTVPLNSQGDASTTKALSAPLMKAVYACLLYTSPSPRDG